MYDDTITLIKYGTRTYDQYGNESVTQTTREVFAKPRSVYASEYYQAAQSGLHPSITFTIGTRADYEGEKELVYHGVPYSVVRVDWTADRDTLRLICEPKGAVSAG